MQLRYKEYDDFIVFNKGFGLRTHRVSDDQFGLVEYLSDKLNLDLFVVHRLDKDTSGLMLFAKNKTAAQELSTLFEKHQIEKTYYFLTDRTSLFKKNKIESHIEKVDNHFINNKSLSPNSLTEIEWIKSTDNLHLWKATPQTGKPHQIRLHAELVGLAILGDTEHNGSPSHRLALHAQSLKFTLNGQNYFFESDVPFSSSLFEDCYNKRNEMYQLESTQSFRLIHQEHPLIRADIFADHIWVYDYTPNGLTAEQKNEVTAFAKKHHYKWLIRHMLDRGSGVSGLEQATLDGQSSENWTASEESVFYQLKTDSGFSPGLFLDQRENRLWVKNNSTQKKVLNLFAYTSGFSVNAAIGNASEVTTVDVSSKFLNWSKENFILNKLDPQKFEFYAQDCLLFLKGALKRNRKWDLIICDPPSFGRSKDSVWKLERDLPELAQLLVSCLNPGGTVLFTCNLEKKTRSEIVKLFERGVQRMKNKYEIQRLPMMSLDYELTDDLKNLLKGFLFQLKL